MDVTPAGGSVGAYVQGVNLAEPLGRETIDRLLSAWHRWGVLFFRDQQLTDAEHLAAASLFGDPVPFGFAPSVDGEGLVHLIDHEDGGRRQGGGSTWHSDATWLERPPRGSMLRGVRLPKVGGDTLFASMSAAFDDLSPRTQAFVDGLTALHDGGVNLTRAARRVGITVPTEPVAHPVIRRHPDTGARCVFVNRLFTKRILELSPSESDAVLPMLCALATRPEHQCRFAWQEGDVAIWDNRSVQHYASPDYDETRVMHRVVLAGDPVL